MNKFDTSRRKIILKFGKNLTANYKNSKNINKNIDFS